MASYPDGLDLLDLYPHERCDGDSVVPVCLFDVERRTVDVDDQVRPVENVDGFGQRFDLSVEELLFVRILLGRTLGVELDLDSLILESIIEGHEGQELDIGDPNVPVRCDEHREVQLLLHHLQLRTDAVGSGGVGQRIEGDAHCSEVLVGEDPHQESPHVSI